MDHVNWSRELPVRYAADVAVMGGGMAGVCAAAAAAAAGAETILIDRFAVTGGNATSGGVGAFCGETAGQGEVFDAIIKGLEAFAAVESYQPYEVSTVREFDHRILSVVLQELLLERKVRLLLHTRFVDALVTDGRINGVIICGASGPEALKADTFVDCTGDGAVARACGFEVMRGRPDDSLQLPMSMMGFVREGPEAGGPQVPQGLFDIIAKEEDLPMTSIWDDGPGGKALKVKIPMFDATNTESLTAAEIQGRRRMMAVLDYYQTQAGKPWRFDGCASIIGIREGCRIMGDYVLTVDDLRAGAEFPDGIARGCFYLDGHKPDDDKRTYILPKDQLKIPPYQIPLRALIARDGSNLLMAGRCLSADQLALSSARVMTTCAMTGQAAGITAAAAKGDLRSVAPSEIRQAIADRGGKLEL